MYGWLHQWKVHEHSLHWSSLIEFVNKLYVLPVQVHHNLVSGVKMISIRSALDKDIADSYNKGGRKSINTS